MICSRKYRWLNKHVWSIHASMTLWLELRLDLATWAFGFQWNPYSCYQHSLTFFIGPIRIELEKDVTGKCKECPSLMELLLVWGDEKDTGLEEPL